MNKIRPITPVKKHVLRLIYRWKLLTTGQMQVLSYHDSKSSYISQCVRELFHDKYITIAGTLSSRTYYRLMPKSLKFINYSGRKPKEDGIRSEHILHDLVVNAFQIGDIPLCRYKHSYEFITEREIRGLKNPTDVIPPGYFNTRRPDGLTWARERNICLEVELSTKKKSRYEYTRSFYQHNAIDAVLWLVKNSAQIKLLQSIFGQQKHQFILLSDFLKNYWDAKVYTGSLSGQTINQIHGVEKSEDQERHKSLSLKNYFLDPIKHAIDIEQNQHRDEDTPECYL